MICVFHPDAELEFAAAMEYYENCERGLGISLLAKSTRPSNGRENSRRLGRYLTTAFGDANRGASRPGLWMPTTPTACSYWP